MGDFHEPYGAIFGEFDNGPSSLLLLVVRFLCWLKNFCHNLAKALQDLCNLHSVPGG